ncbi:MAG: hypothetical protein LBQ09_05565 [Acidobacteriaceae bacterium]|nr:hypothetical protein [Acidobacteriaceae bacterium]
MQWEVVAGNVRPSKLVHGPVGDYGWRHRGVDETEPGDFTITLKMPKNATAFIETLTRAAAQAKELSGRAGALISFVLPIEPNNHDQIQIDWKSAPPSPQKIAAVRKAKLAATAAKKAAASRRSVKKTAVKKVVKKVVKKAATRRR